MTQPIILNYLSQIFEKHYKLPKEQALQEAKRLDEIFELYGMKLIIGEWLVPEPAPPAVVRSPLEVDLSTWKESMEREPWNPPELKN
jgi:hypothetical protein